MNAPAAIAFFTDVHGDLHSLQDAVIQAARLGCATLVCGGDLVDGEPFPDEVIALLRESVIPTIRGNHDRWAIGAGRAIEPYGELVGAPYDASAFGLSQASIRYLHRLPTYWETTVDGVRIAAHHGRPGDDMRGVYPDLDRAEAATLLDAASADILLIGHTHEPFVAELADGRLIANPGALWQGGGRSFGVLDVTDRSFRVYRAGGDEQESPRVRFKEGP
jgi:predicted phosphodiesterase